MEIKISSNIRPGEMETLDKNTVPFVFLTIYIFDFIPKVSSNFLTNDQNGD